MVNLPHPLQQHCIKQGLLFTIFILVACLFSNTLIASALEIQPDKIRTELGIPVFATIVATGHTENLNDINLSPLAENFGITIEEFFIETDDSPKNTSNKTHTIQSLKVRLYPRLIGELILPALTFHNSVTKVKTIDVTPAIIRGTAVRIETKISANRVWQRQQLLVNILIETPEKFSSLELEKYPAADMNSHNIQPSREWRKERGNSKTLLRTGWILYPQQAGEQTLELPAIKYITGGTVERIFHLPRTSINVRALPPYIPPTIPVGKTELATSSDSTMFLSTDTVLHWQVTLSGTSLPPPQLPALLKQIKSSDDLVFLPPESTHSSSPDQKGMHGEIRHRVPFKSVSSGFSYLPALKVQYFDPASGRLEFVTTPETLLFTLGTGWRFFFTCLFIVLFIVAFRFGARFLLHRMNRRKLLQCAYTEIEQARNWSAIHHGLNLYAKAQGWPENMTLTQWRKQWLASYARNEELDQLIIDTENACYQKTSLLTIQSIRTRLLTRLYYPGPLVSR